MRGDIAAAPLLLALALGACGQPGESEAEEAEELPEAKAATIRLEGTPEQVRLRLFETPDDFALRFHTYYPEDFVVETSRTGEGDAVRFTAEFGGRREENAFLHVLVYPPDVDEQTALSLAKGWVASRAVGAARGVEFPERRPDLPDRFPWALYEDDFMFQTPEGDWVLGTIAVGRRGDRLFHVILNYPEDYAEGFTPRADRVFAEWVWERGEPLQGPTGPLASPPGGGVPVPAEPVPPAAREPAADTAAPR